MDGKSPGGRSLCDGEKPFVRNGSMQVSDKPGIGVELNDDAARKLTVAKRSLLRDSLTSTHGEAGTFQHRLVFVD